MIVSICVLVRDESDSRTKELEDILRGVVAEAMDGQRVIDWDVGMVDGDVYAEVPEDKRRPREVRTGRQ